MRFDCGPRGRRPGLREHGKELRDHGPKRQPRRLGRKRGRSFDSVDITCSLSSLDSVGEALANGRRLTVTGGATGVLDVSTLTSIEHFLFRDTLLTRIVLPSNRPFSIGQFEVERNDELLEISGFDGVELTMSGGTLQLRVVDNPLLSTCWANDLGAHFQSAYEFAGVTISGNAPDCP